jgi:PAS domain S-box-containing protein
MTEKPPYEEELKRKNIELNFFINNIPDMAWVKDVDSRFIAVNRAFGKAVGMEPEPLINNTCEVCFGEEEAKKFREDDLKVMKGGKQEIYEEKVIDSQKNEIWLETIKSPILDESGNVIGTVGIARDITTRKKGEEALEKLNLELEHRVQERTRELESKSNDLEELNAALKVLLDKRREDQEDFQEGILANIKTLIDPYIVKLKKSKLPQSQKTLLNILESNLNEIISPFTKRLSSKYLNLTPKEIKIANLVKHGKTNKEIAEIQGVASRTIAAHRENIRKKLGLTNKKTNLKTFLQTLP